MAVQTLGHSHQIRELAYRRFIARGCGHGDDLADWLAAEQEVLPMEATGNRWEMLEPIEEEISIGDQQQEETGYHVG